jgi:hypothetical protein
MVYCVFLAPSLPQAEPPPSNLLANPYWQASNTNALLYLEFYGVRRKTLLSK